MTTLSAYLETDLLGYECLPEAALDDPAVWAAGKGVRLPQTCLTEVPVRSRDALAEVIGRPPTDAEFKIFSYRHCTYFESCGFGVPGLYIASSPPPTTPVPLPAGGVMLGLLLVLLAVWRRR